MTQSGNALDLALGLDSAVTDFYTNSAHQGAIIPGLEDLVDTTHHGLEGCGVEREQVEEGKIEEGEIEEGKIGVDLDGIEEGEVKESKVKKSEVERDGVNMLHHLNHRQHPHHHCKAHAQSEQHNPHCLREVVVSLLLTVEVDISHLPFASCGYQGTQDGQRNGKGRQKKTRGGWTKAKGGDNPNVQELMRDGYQLVVHKPGISQPIVNTTTQKVVAVAVGVIDNPSYLKAANDTFTYLEEVTQAMNLNATNFANNQHGPFAAVNYGISYSQGSTKPHWLSCDYKSIMCEVLTNPNIRFLGMFANLAFATWSPKVYQYYEDYAQKLCDRVPNLTWQFYHLVWLHITVNFGPAVCCTLHRDFLNLPFGWCAAIALGNFNYHLGGHIILNDLKLVIELPPGGLMLLPSALLIHRNTPVQPREKQMSFTHFSAGGIFQYINNGFRTEKQLERQDKQAYKEMQDAHQKTMGIGLWSTMKELLAPV